MLQQTFEDLTTEHEQTLRRLNSVREENENLKASAGTKGGAGGSTPLGSAVTATGGTLLLAGSGAASSDPAAASSSSNTPRGININPGLQGPTLSPKNSKSTTSSEKDSQIEQLQKQIKGLHRDLDKLLREKEEHFFEKENFVDRRLVLSMASQLQSEPNPSLKDQILAQMIEVLCVDETWKQLVPKRPVSTRAKAGGTIGASLGKPAPLSDALIDFVDRELAKEGGETTPGGSPLKRGLSSGAAGGAMSEEDRAADTTGLSRPGSPTKEAIGNAGGRV